MHSENPNPNPKNQNPESKKHRLAHSQQFLGILGQNPNPKIQNPDRRNPYGIWIVSCMQRWHMYNEIHRDDTHSVICTKMAHALYRDGSHWQLGLVLKSVKCSTCADMAHP